MTQLFTTLFNGSIAAGWLVLALVLLRPLIRKAPRWISVALWGLVALRLVCPFFLESGLSLIPTAQVIAPEILADAAPSIQSGIPAVDEVIEPVVQEFFTPGIGDSVDPLQVWLPVCAGLWSLGGLAMGVYAVASWLLLKRQVRTAVLLRDNVYQSERVRTPFVLGVIRPRIYLPFGLEEGELTHILAHEQAHIQRKDHWWKLLGFVLLAMSWYHPLMWLAYILLCRDIEAACDEKVIRQMDPGRRADYAQAMLRCSAGRPRLGACPVAFGEVGVKARIKHVLKYKKPAFWILLITVLLCIVLVVCFLTNPLRTPVSVQTQQDLYTAGKLVAHMGEAVYMPVDGTQEYPEIRIGTEGLQLRRENDGMRSFPYVKTEWITREALVEQLSLPENCTAEYAWSYGYWNRDGDFEPEEAVPQCEWVAVCSYRENEADVYPEYIVYFFDGEPRWFADVFEPFYDKVSLPDDIYELQPPESSEIRPMVLYIRDGGTFAVEDYGEYLMNPHFQTMYTYGSVEDYRQAGNAGIQAIADRFGEHIRDSHYLRGCIVYYDEDDDVWYVRLHIVSALTVLGGSYAVILNSDGSVLSIWGEK